MTTEQRLPTLHDLFVRLKRMNEAGTKPGDRHCIDAFNVMRMNADNPAAVKEVIDLIDAFMAFRDDPPTELSTSLWKGMLVAAGIAASRFVDDEPSVRSYLNIIYALLDVMVISDSDFTNAERFFSKVSLLADPADEPWVAANLEVRFALVGKEGAQKETEIADQLLQTARRFHPQLFVHAGLLRAYVASEYGNYRDGFIYGQQAWILAKLLGLPHLERSALTYMANFAVQLDGSPLIERIMVYWNWLRQDGDTDLETAMIYAIAWQRFYRRRNYVQAEECATFAVEFYQGRGIVAETLKMQIALAMIYVKQMRFREAINLSHDAFVLAHTNRLGVLKIRALHTEGWALLKDGQYPAAIEVLSKALEMALQLPASNQRETFRNGIVSDLASALAEVRPLDLNASQSELVLGLIWAIFAEKEVENLPKWIKKQLRNS